MPTLTQNLTAATTAKEAAETELKNLKAETVKTEVANLIAAGLSEGKFTKETSVKLAADYATNPDGTNQKRSHLANNGNKKEKKNSNIKKVS